MSFPSPPQLLTKMCFVNPARKVLCSKPQTFEIYLAFPEYQLALLCLNTCVLVTILPHTHTKKSVGSSYTCNRLAGKRKERLRTSYGKHVNTKDWGKTFLLLTFTNPKYEHSLYTAASKTYRIFLKDKTLFCNAVPFKNISPKEYLSNGGICIKIDSMDIR